MTALPPEDICAMLIASVRRPPRVPSSRHGQPGRMSLHQQRTAATAVLPSPAAAGPSRPASAASSACATAVYAGVSSHLWRPTAARQRCARSPFGDGGAAAAAAGLVPNIATEGPASLPPKTSWMVATAASAAVAQLRSAYAASSSANASPTPPRLTAFAASLCARCAASIASSTELTLACAAWRGHVCHDQALTRRTHTQSHVYKA